MRKVLRSIQTIAMLALACGAVSVASAAYILSPGDVVYGVAATGPGSPISSLALPGTVAGANNYPSAESPALAVDNNLGTKYLNFAEINVGLLLQPAIGPTYLSGVIFGTANDATERDPMRVVIQGANPPFDPLVGALNTTWTTVYDGVTGLATDPGRNTWGPEVGFTLSTTAYSVYRVLITEVRNGPAANSVQFSEIQLIGVVPEPGCATLFIVGLVAVAYRIRRRVA